MTEAVFGDASRLSVDAFDASLFAIPLEFRIRGGSIEGAPVAAAMLVRRETTGVPGKYGKVLALAGGLEFGDPLTGTPCTPGQSYVTRAFTMGGVAFEGKLCTYDANLAIGYDFKSLSVTDSDSSVPEALRGTSVVLGGERIVRDLRSMFYHHNHCDSFVVRIGELGNTYGFTASQIENDMSSAVLDGAPMCAGDGGTRRDASSYIFRADDGRIRTGDAEFSHFER